jgi:ribosomal protein L9
MYELMLESAVVFDKKINVSLQKQNFRTGRNVKKLGRKFVSVSGGSVIMDRILMDVKAQ